MAPVKKPTQEIGITFLKEWREAIGLSQEEAGNEIGISRSQLSRIEAGKKPYIQWQLEAAAKLYGCEPFELLVVNPKVSSDYRQLLDIAKVAENPEKAQIKAFIEFTLKQSDAKQ